MPKRNVVAEPNQHSIVATCVFNAPRELVFRLMIDPAQIPDWWGPRSLTLTVDHMEARPGGSWRYVLHNKQGKEWAFHGVYHGVEAPERMVYTFEIEELPGKVSLETYIFEDHADGTKLTMISVFQSVADRDNMIHSGMDDGNDEAMDRLEEVLATMLVVS